MLALHCCAQIALCFLGRHLSPGTMPWLCRNRTHPEDDRLIAFPFSPHKTNAAFCKRVRTSYLGSQAAVEPLQMPVGSPPFRSLSSIRFHPFAFQHLLSSYLTSTVCFPSPRRVVPRRFPSRLSAWALLFFPR